MQRPYRDALDVLDARTFHRKHVGILKLYFRDLRTSSEDDAQLRVLRFLSTRPQINLVSKNVVYSLLLGQPSVDTQTGAMSVALANHQYLHDEDGDGEVFDDQQLPWGQEEIQGFSDRDAIAFFRLLGEQFFQIGAPFETLKQRVEGLSRPPRSLTEALERRNLQAVSDYLQENFERSATGEYDWLVGLQKMEYSHEDIAKLLHGSVTDSPWIFHELRDIATAELDVGYHQHACPHQFLSDTSQQGTAPQDSDAEIESVPDEGSSTS